MKTLSYTQEYYLCAVNKKGRMPSFKSTDIAACFLAGGLMELRENGFIRADEKDKYTATKPLDAQFDYLRPLYDIIADLRKPRSVKWLADKFLFSGRRSTQLLSAVGASLVQHDCVDELLERGWFKETTRYAPKPESTRRVIEKVRAEFLEEGAISDEAVCLGALLAKSGLVRSYFSKVEAEELKKRLKQIRSSEAYKTVKEILDYADMIVAAIASSAAH